MPASALPPIKGHRLANFLHLHRCTAKLPGSTPPPPKRSSTCKFPSFASLHCYIAWFCSSKKKTNINLQFHSLPLPVPCSLSIAPCLCHCLIAPCLVHCLVPIAPCLVYCLSHCLIAPCLVLPLPRECSHQTIRPCSDNTCKQRVEQLRF